MWQLLLGLDEAGHAVTLTSLNPNKHHLAHEKWPPELRIIATEVDTTPGYWSALTSALFQRTPYPVLRYLHAGFAEQLSRLLTNETFDVIQLETVFMTPYIDVIRRYSRAPIVLRAHNAEHEIWQRMAHHERQLLRKFYYQYLAVAMKKYEAEVVKGIDGLLTLTHTDADAFRKLGYTGKQATIHPWVCVPEHAPQVTEGCEVAYLGALNWLPNLQGLQWFIRDVWPNVLERMPEAKLDIAGKAPLPQVFKWAGKRITIQGEVDDAHAFLAKFAVVIIPVQAGSGIRLKLLEAMALGKAVVTTTEGAQGAGVQSGREVFIADAPETFAACIVELLQNPTRRLAMAAHARAYVKAVHNQADAMAALHSFYDELNIGTSGR